MKKDTHIVFYTTLCLLLLISCTNQSNFERGADECLGSFETFAYHVPDWGVRLYEEKVLPLPPWEIVTRISENQNSDEKSNYWMETIRTVKRKDEIWFGKRTLQEGYWRGKFYIEDYLHEILIYRPDEGEWDRSTIFADIEGTDVYVDSLYVTSDGSVWGVNRWNTRLDQHSFDQVPVLSRYNDATGRFEYAKGVLSIPIVEDIFDYFDWPIILLDQEDVFWIFIPKDAIYSYDTKTDKTRRHVSISNTNVQEAVLAPDGNIYFQELSFFAEIQRDEIYLFSPLSGEITPIVPPHEHWPGGPIGVDHLGNLWIGAIGYRTPEGLWQLLHPDPEGYIENYWKDPRWATATFLLESTNGILWFYKWTDAPGNEGLAWYDPRTGEGCWFTTEAVFYSFLEDSHQNLWLLLDGNLYRYALEP
jgi:sugar lactone lactonase YvrE